MCNGPGKVGQSLAVNKETMNGMDLIEGDFKVVDMGIDGFEMGVSRRVNIDYAEEWVDTPWRFYVKGNTYVSKVNFDAPKKEKKWWFETINIDVDVDVIKSTSKLDVNNKYNFIYYFYALLVIKTI